MGKPSKFDGRTNTRRVFAEQLEDRRMMAGDTVVPLTPAEVEEKIASYRSYYDEVMATEHDQFLQASILTGTTGAFLYNLQYAVDGVLSMYEATGDREVLNTAILYVTNVMNEAEVIEDGYYESDGFLDWETLSGGKPMSRRQGTLLHDFQFASPMSRLARIIHEDVRLQDDAQLQGFGDTLTEFVEQQIVVKWLDFRYQREWLEGFYAKNGYWTDKATHIINICHNLTSIQGEDTACDGIEQSLGEHFKNQLVIEDDGAYVWGLYDPWPRGFFNLSPDTAHESRVVTMITNLGPDNVVFDQTDIWHLGKTFTERIWNGRTDWEDRAGVQESPWFHNYIDGSDDNYSNYSFYLAGTEGMNGLIYDGWVKLGQFIPEAQLASDALLSYIQDTSWATNSIRQRNGTRWGKIALAGQLAKNLRLSSPVPDPTATQVSAAFIEEETATTSDINSDGVVSFADFLVMSNNFGKTEDQDWSDGDLDGDGAVAMSDFLVMSAAWP